MVIIVKIPVAWEFHLDLHEKAEHEAQRLGVLLDDGFTIASTILIPVEAIIYVAYTLYKKSYKDSGE